MAFFNPQLSVAPCGLYRPFHTGARSLAKARTPSWTGASHRVADSGRVGRVKFTRYFEAMRQRPDRAMIELQWIQWVIDNPVKELIQQDGRIRRWAPISEMAGRCLRVVLLADGETVHNAFFDRSFTP